MSQLYGLQALRAVAALMVAAHHVQVDATLLAQRTGGGFAPSSVLPWMAGVDIFFVVSGFIMVHASADLFGRPGATRLFMARRLARIVPLYWAVTTLFLIVGLVLPATLNSGAPDLSQIAGSYLFWPVVSTTGLVQPVYSLGWTLNYEMLFYALFGAGLLLPGRWTLPAVTAALVGLITVEWLAGPLPLPFGFWGLPIVLEFALGMGLAVLWRHGFRLGFAARLLAVLAGLAILLAAATQPGVRAPWSTLVWHGSAATLLVLAVTSGTGATRAPSVALRALARLGDASYALYLVHPFMIRGLREIFVRIGLGSPALFIMAGLVASVAAALVVYRVFERPATRWLRRRLDA